MDTQALLAKLDKYVSEKAGNGAPRIDDKEAEDVEPQREETSNDNELRLRRGMQQSRQELWREIVERFICRRK